MRPSGRHSLVCQLPRPQRSAPAIGSSVARMDAIRMHVDRAQTYAGPLPRRQPTPAQSPLLSRANNLFHDTVC